MTTNPQNALLNREPVLTAAVLQTIVVVVLAFVHFTPSQLASLEGVFVAVTAWVTRGQVTPVFSPYIPHLGITPSTGLGQIQNVVNTVAQDLPAAEAVLAPLVDSSRAALAAPTPTFMGEAAAVATPVVVEAPAPAPPEVTPTIA